METNAGEGVKMSAHPTPMTLRQYDELRHILAGDNISSAAELAEGWGCTIDTMWGRIRRMRKCGLALPPLFHRKISIKLCGNPAEPECPHCAAAGRIAANGHTVHLQTDGYFHWCEVCGYDPDYTDAIMPPPTEMQLTALHQWEATL